MMSLLVLENRFDTSKATLLLMPQLSTCAVFLWSVFYVFVFINLSINFSDAKQFTYLHMCYNSYGRFLSYNPDSLSIHQSMPSIGSLCGHLDNLTTKHSMSFQEDCRTPMDGGIWQLAGRMYFFVTLRRNWHPTLLIQNKDRSFSNSGTKESLT